MRAAILIGLLATATLAGCVDPTQLDSDSNLVLNLRDPDVAGTLDLLAGTALWEDHQDEPHPAFGWPTLSNPAPDAISWHTPIEGLELLNITTGFTEASPTSGVTQGAGIALYGSIAVVPGYGPDTAIVDITDPESPQVLSKFAPQPWVNPNDANDTRQSAHRGATVIAYPDGRIVTAISTSLMIDVWDITDPADPLPLPPLYPTQGSHKVGVIPGTPIVYNAASCGGSPDGVDHPLPVTRGACLAGAGHTPDGANGFTEIFDLSDPLNPVHVQDWVNGYSCHHVYFWNDASQDKQRGICAGIEATQIWDTSDPLNPEVIVTVPVHHGIAGTPSASVPIVAFSHFAGLNKDGTILLVGDEMGGGGLPPGCVASFDPPSGASVPFVGYREFPVDQDGSFSVPVGALWFYDVSDETNPVLKGWYAPTWARETNPNDLRSCTAHHGRLVPDASGRDIIAMSFYGAGVHMIDFTDPTLPFAMDKHNSGSDTWETWYYNGYLFTGDLERGMEVFKVDSID